MSGVITDPMRAALGVACDNRTCANRGGDENSPCRGLGFRFCVSYPRKSKEDKPADDGGQKPNNQLPVSVGEWSCVAPQ